MNEDGLDFIRSLGNVTRDGAAMDGALSEQATAALPRILRYAFLTLKEYVQDRVVAEIIEAHPSVSVEATRWASGEDQVGWASLAATLDAAAVFADRTTLRSLADVVRMVSMPVGEAVRNRTATLRVVAALRESLKAAVASPHHFSPHLYAGVEQMILGWTSIAGGDLERFSSSTQVAHEYAAALGRSATRYIRLEIEDRFAERQRQAKRDRVASEQAASAASALHDLDRTPDGRIVVCPHIEKSSSKSKDSVRGHEHVIGVPLPLAPMPDIAAVRHDLVASFPHAVAAIDTLLAPLVGRATVSLPPVILVGPPGAGKSFLVRRLAEALGVGIWRTSGANADGAAFGGTDRRWHSTEPAHPFLAISRTRIANPLVLIDEIEKAGTRQDFGRLWDCLLCFLEKETAARHPDPCLQVELDLSHVGYIATANSLLALPGPLLDRFRVVEMPEPRAEDLAILVPPLMADLAREQGLNEAWSVPLSASELDLLANKWRGGSVRRLRAYLGVILRARDRVAPLH